MSNLSIIRFRIICVLDLNCNHVHNNLRVFEQMKRRVIISNKHGNCISELPHELPNNLRLRIVGNQEIPVEKSVAKQKLLQNRNLTFAVMCYFTWKLELVSNVLSMVVSYVNFTVSVPYALVFLLALSNSYYGSILVSLFGLMNTARVSLQF